MSDGHLDAVRKASRTVTVPPTYRGSSWQRRGP